MYLKENESNYLNAESTEMDKELPYQLIGAGYDFHQHPVDRPFGYPAYQWIQTISGSGILKIRNKEFLVEESMGMLLFEREPHEYQAIEKNWYVNWISFHGYHIEKMLYKLGFKKSGIFSISNASTIEILIKRAFQTIKNNVPLYGMDGSVIVYSLLFELYRGVRPNGDLSQGENIKRLKPVLDFIKKNIEYSISLQELASLIGVTTQHFCVLFKEITGYRPVDYINYQRIILAKELFISHPHLKVNEVGKRVGFINNSYFSTIFKKYEGISPKLYKESQ